MSKVHQDSPAKCEDGFAVVLLDNGVYLGGLFGKYEDAQLAAKTLGMPSTIIRYSIPIALDGKHCTECIELILKKHGRIQTNDIKNWHEQEI